MNLLVTVNHGKKELHMILSKETPPGALGEEVRKTFCLDSMLWQHYFKDKPVNICAAELEALLSRATESGETEPLQTRLGEGCCKVDAGQPALTLYVQKQRSEAPARAAAAAAAAAAAGSQQKKEDAVL